MRYLYLLITCLFLLPMHSAVAGEWRYVNPATSESVASETVAMGADAQTTRQPAKSKRDVGPVPINNMTMDVVRTQFGQPNSEATPVGEPPINRWYYETYTVYFEVDRVIISVVN